MRRALAFLVVLAAVGLTAGCGMGQDKGDAEYFAGSFYETIKVKDFQTVLTFYSPKFFEQVSREEWLKVLQDVNAKLGDLQEYTLVNWNFRKYYGTTGSGTYFQFLYKVTYTKHPADETLTVFKPLLGGDMVLLGHRINSVGFVKS